MENNELGLIIALVTGGLALVGTIVQSVITYIGGRKQPADVEKTKAEVSQIQGTVYGTIIDELQEQMKTMTGKVEKMENELTSAQGRVAELETELDRECERSAQLEERANVLETKIVVLQAQQKWYEIYIERLVGVLKEHDIPIPPRPKELN